MQLSLTGVDEHGGEHEELYIDMPREKMPQKQEP